MANTSRIVDTPPAAVEMALKYLGRNIRTARLRRKLRIEDGAEKMGASRYTVAELEKGKPGTPAAADFGGLWGPGWAAQAGEIAHPGRRATGQTVERAGGGEGKGEGVRGSPGGRQDH